MAVMRFKDVFKEGHPLQQKLSFKDLHPTEYKPGEDELTNYRAYRRKRTHGVGTGEGGPIGESVKYPHMMYDPKTGKEVEAKTPADHEKYAKMGYTHEKPNVDEALDIRQRLARSRLFKRYKSKIKLGRDRAKRRMAKPEVLKRRSVKQARTLILKKITKGIPKDELSFARRQEIEKRLDKPAANARVSFPYRIYLSQSQDQKKNPLQYKEKIKIARKMFPKHARQIIMDPKIKNVFDVMAKLYNEGFRKVVMVVGSDRVNEFDVLLNKYNGKKGKHGFYNFERIQTISAGERDPDADGAEGMSASKMRSAASENDFTSFSQGLPKTISNADAKSIYNSVRKGMGLKEQKIFKNHIQLNPVSDLRESYIDGALYNVGDQVKIKETGEIVEITTLGSNYIIVENSGKQCRKWLDAVEKVNENMQRFKSFEAKDQDPCWKGYTQYGMKKKGGKQVPNCVPESEAVDHVDATKERINRERMRNKIRHDRMMDQARMRATATKNKETK